MHLPGEIGTARFAMCKTLKARRIIRSLVNLTGHNQGLERDLI